MPRFLPGAILLIAVLEINALCSPAVAQEGGPAARIARFTDPQTLAVLRIDLERLELPGADALLRGVPLDEASRGLVEAALEHLRQGLDAWKKLGAKEAFYVVSLADLPRGGGGFLVLPGAEPTPGTEEPESLRQFGRCEVVSGALICAQRETIARLQQQTTRRDLPADAFQAVEEAPVQLILAPSDDHRRVLRELSPSLPAEWGGLTGETVADGVVWAAAGLKLTPAPAVQVVVQSRDAAAAKRLQQAMEGGLRALVQHPQAREHLPDPERAVRTLTPQVEQDRLVLNASTADPLAQAVLGQLSRAGGQLQTAADRDQSRNNLHQLGLAMHNFHDVYSSFPPTASYDNNGKPLLSWRVYVLPFVEAYPLYQEFRLNEPWDSEHNKRLIAKMPPAFASPNAAAAAAEGKTPYLAPIGESVLFTGGPAGIPISEITDGTSNTIMLIEVPAEEAVVWTKPDDWQVNLDEPLKGLIPEGREGFLALIADGSVRFISKAVDAASLKAMFTRNAGDVPRMD